MVLSSKAILPDNSATMSVTSLSVFPRHGRNGILLMSNAIRSVIQV